MLIYNTYTYTHMESATIRVSKSTLRLLEDLKRRRKLKSYDALIRELIKEKR